MTMKHRGYTGSVEYDAEDRIFHGAVNGIADVVTFEGTSVEELETSFRTSVDVYLEWCAKDGIEPARPYSGRFVLRIPPEVHCDVTIAARTTNESMNTWILHAIQTRLEAWRAARPDPFAADRLEDADEPEDAAAD